MGIRQGMLSLAAPGHRGAMRDSVSNFSCAEIVD
jgi:hypothetical protein